MRAREARADADARGDQHEGGDREEHSAPR
jgi:hypothetical protein